MQLIYLKQVYRTINSKDKMDIEMLNKMLEDMKISNTSLHRMLEDKEKEEQKLITKLEETNKKLQNLQKTKGSQCSVSGNKYERCIHDILKHCYINNKQFNTQEKEELAGSSCRNDLECNFIGEKDIGLEAKIYRTQDWMQCSIKYNDEINKWESKEKSKLPNRCRVIFDNLINDINLYEGEIPLFMKKSITHEKWLEIKDKTNKWDDKYFDVPSDTISKLYQNKGCSYIQISDGYGLFHLGNDPCKFDVPFFNVEQQIRIRTKIHTKKTKKRFCSISVTVACQPKNIKEIKQSKYSLDNIDKLPPPLTYKLKI